MCSMNVRMDATGRAWWLVAGVVSLLILTTTGCLQKKTTQTVSLGDWPKRDGPMVFGGQSERGADAQTATQWELSEAQWKILERFGPRNTWDRIRKNRDAIVEARKKVPLARAADSQKGDPNQVTLPEVPTESLGGGKIQMFYRVRHFGEIPVTASRNGGMNRRTVTVGKPNERDLTPLVTLLQERLGDNGTVRPMPTENMLIIICTDAMKTPVLTLLARVDATPMQVEITGQIFEVRHDMDFQAGVRLLVQHMDLTGNQQGWAGNFSAEAFAATAGAPFPGDVPDPGTAMRLVQVFGKSGINASATIQALANTNMAKMIAEPRMTVASGKTAYMLAGQELPVTSGRLSNDNLVTEKTSYKPIGVQLYITPLVIGPDAVKLHIVTVVSAVQGFVELPDLNTLTTSIVNPILDTREAETTVSVPDGAALVIGGLRQVRSITGESKVPGLGDIPILGWLFKSHRSQKQITDLYFFVTPRIVYT